ncbi:MAG: tRNA-dihydrouridine synthase family protein [Kiritimatiellae bacterium]|nr:tRNA-dihydrouridine synthase family protein [Kiritimatiellia bacterium]
MMDKSGTSPGLILAPLRGVTIRCFRETFAREIREAGFTEAITPFIAANQGVDPLKDRELRNHAIDASIPLTPQFIGKDPSALKDSLIRIKEAGFTTADLNCGCPFPMVRNKGRGSGILRTPDILARMLAAGCETLGERCFSVKTRLGVEKNDELLALMPVFNAFPLRFITVHARNARQMYEGECDAKAFLAVREASANPVVYNGDAPLSSKDRPLMVGRAFVRCLGERDDARELLKRYAAASLEELHAERPVIGRMKELLAYWKDMPRWRARWTIAKTARSLQEFLLAIS